MIPSDPPLKYLNPNIKLLSLINVRIIVEIKLIKKILGKSHYLIEASATIYHEVTPACFEQTMARSTILDTDKIKKNLEAFNAQ